LVAAGEVPLRPGIAELLALARRHGLRLAIATTTTESNVHALLRATLGPQAPGWFEVIGTGDVVAAKKPALDIYRWVVKRLGLPASACLALEDSKIGLQSALTAGIPCIVTPTADTADQDFTEAVAVWNDLPAHLGELAACFVNGASVVPARTTLACAA
jgi:beta-phosphoglucomutase-like phosphatase (HAD superfamily)